MKLMKADFKGFLSCNTEDQTGVCCKAPVLSHIFF